MNTPPPPASLSSKSISTEKAQPIPWTHQETVNLILAYQEKWYALERGQLKSNQWEEVAVAVASRCGYSHFHPSKTLVQCRHKIEKLRQRFRSEKNRLAIGTLSSSRWLYFELMNNLLQGPLPISARPMSSLPFEYDLIAEKSDHYSSDYEEEEKNPSKSKSISNILRRPMAFDGSSSRRRNRNSSDEEEDEDEEKEEEEEEEEERNIRVSRFPEEDLAGDAAGAEEGKEMCSKVAAEIRVFADRLVGMESLKMKMMKEAEMNRIAMENRRIEMILESEKKIVNSIAKAFGSHPPKKLKIGHDS